jgi:hypothetical protein
MRTTRTIGIALLIALFSLNINCGRKDTPSDAQMIEHFNLHLADFKKLCSWIEEDNINHFPLYSNEKRDGVVLTIPKEREAEYDTLMSKTGIISFSHPYRYRDVKSQTIQFYYFGKGDATWGIDKGYEYDPGKEEMQERFTNNELLNEALTLNKNVFLYKVINENWNLFLIYDR